MPCFPTFLTCIVICRTGSGGMFQATPGTVDTNSTGIMLRHLFQLLLIQLKTI